LRILFNTNLHFTTKSKSLKRITKLVTEAKEQEIAMKKIEDRELLQATRQQRLHLAKIQREFTQVS